MTKPQHIRLHGRRYVLLTEAEFNRLRRRTQDVALPALPAPDANGELPAVEFARASIARTIIKQRKSAGLSQQELADRAGLRQETLSRIESGKHTATVRTIQKIERALGRLTTRRAG